MAESMPPTSMSQSILSHLMVDDDDPKNRPRYVNEAKIRGWDFICGFCDKCLWQPRQTQCGKRICYTCLLDQFKGVDEISSCPVKHNDEDDMDIDDDDPHDGMTVFRMKDFPKDHACQKKLIKEPVYCPNHGCPEKIPYRGVSDHMQVCGFVKESCKRPGCKETFFRKDADDHDAKCPYAEVQCEFCTATVQRVKLPEHMDNKCPSSHNLVCQSCKQKFQKRNEVIAHQRISAKCVQRGGACYYEKFGCDFTCDEKDASGMKKHLENPEKKRAHQDMIVVNLDSVNNTPASELVTSINKKIRPLELLSGDLFRQVNQVRQKMSDQETTVAGLNDMTKNLNIVQQDIDTIKRKQEVADRKTDKKLQEVEKTVEDLQLKIATVQSIVQATADQTMGSSGSKSSKASSSTDTQVAAVMSLLQKGAAGGGIPSSVGTGTTTAMPPSTNGELVWVIDDWDKKMRAARLGEQPSIYSDPFYTSPQGHKMRARAYLNGDGPNKGKKMSVFFVLMKHKYDHTLEWPFRRRISFAVIKPGTGDIAEKPRIFVPDRGIAFLRPTRESNPATGCPDFLDLTKVKNYLENDKLTLLITVETQPSTDSWYHKVSRYNPNRRSDSVY